MMRAVLLFLWAVSSTGCARSALSPADTLNVEVSDTGRLALVYGYSVDPLIEPAAFPDRAWLWRYGGSAPVGELVPSDSSLLPRPYGDLRIAVVTGAPESRDRAYRRREHLHREKGWSLVGSAAAVPFDRSWLTYVGEGCFQLVRVGDLAASKLGLDGRETWRVCDREGRAEAFRVPDSLRVGFATEADRQTYLRALGERSPSAVR